MLRLLFKYWSVRTVNSIFPNFFLTKPIQTLLRGILISCCIMLPLKCSEIESRLPFDREYGPQIHYELMHDYFRLVDAITHAKKSVMKFKFGTPRRQKWSRKIIYGLQRRTIQTINFKLRGFNSTRSVCYSLSIKAKIRHIRHYYRFKIQFVSNAMSLPYKMIHSKDAKFLASIGIFSCKFFFSNRIINANMIIELAFHLVSSFSQTRYITANDSVPLLVPNQLLKWQGRELVAFVEASRLVQFADLEMRVQTAERTHKKKSLKFS